MLCRRRKILSTRLSFMTETPSSRERPLSGRAFRCAAYDSSGRCDIFLHTECHEPWCVEVAKGAELARMLRPQAQNLIICHMVLEGRCWVRMPDGEAVALHAGDVAAIPHGDSHLIGSGLNHAPVSVDHVVKIKGPHLTPIRYGGEGNRTVLMCGWFCGPTTT